MNTMNRVIFLTTLLLLLFPVLHAQQTHNGVPSEGKCNGCPQTRDGSGTLGLTYKRDTCGLSYIAISERVGQRFPPPGVVQPITKTVSGLPPCYQVDKAFLWIDASGSGIPITATITNPASVTQNFPMTVIGSGPDKCWGYSGTYSYRADVTSIISGNGNYQFSGFPVSTSTSGEDVDGMMLMIIYRDVAATWEGHLLIHDGADVQLSAATTQSLAPISACAAATPGSSRSFCIIADVQNVGSTVSMDNVAQVFTQEYWNYLDQPMAQITPATANVDYSVTASGDCYNLMMIGVYYQTTSCNVCVPSTTVPLSLNATATGSCVTGTGSVTTTVSGGTAPYTYNWQPGNYNTQTVNNLPPGSYTVVVTDASGCAVGTDTAVIATGTPPTAQFALTPSPIASFPGQICMTDQTVGGTQWQWVINGTPSGNASNLCYTLPDTGTYCVQLLVGNAAGCFDTTQQCVDADAGSYISVPNVYTPNGDGFNDNFEVTWGGMCSLRCSIYNRWGELVYEWDGLTGKWNGRMKNGKDASDGVYYWVVDAVTCLGEAKNLTGFVHLIRGK
jgi:gliding motility-associated-like protein